MTIRFTPTPDVDHNDNRLYIAERKIVGQDYRNVGITPMCCADLKKKLLLLFPWEILVDEFVGDWDSCSH